MISCWKGPPSGPNNRQINPRRVSNNVCVHMSETVRRTVTFQAPRDVRVVESPIPTPDPDQVRVRTRRSAISPGTERLIYRGKVPSGLQADTDIDALSGDLSFPLSYGYAAVGQVVACGANVDKDWSGQWVFSFQPHTSHFVSSPENLVQLPEEATVEDGVMIPNLETATNLVMDGRPMIGERVVLFGQGVVGLLTTALLDRHPVTCFSVEPNPSRRTASKEWGADESFHPSDDWDFLRDVLGIRTERSNADEKKAGADLSYELSGNPSALDDAISITGFDGRVIVGSWYGTKEVPLHLGEQFHRSRIQLKSSQVSTVDPDYSGRWTKDRRMGVVLKYLETLQPGSLISDQFPITDAPSVYQRLDSEADDLLQPVFRYG